MNEQVRKSEEKDTPCPTSHCEISGSIDVREYSSNTSLVQVVPLYFSILKSRFRPVHVEGGGAYSCYHGRLHVLWDALDCYCHHLKTHTCTSHKHRFRNIQTKTARKNTKKEKLKQLLKYKTILKYLTSTSTKKGSCF